MITKEKVKEKIDKISEDLLEQVYNFINSIKSKKTKKENSYF